MSSILKGVRVIEMGHFVAVPAAGTILGDWGAEVIKIEPPIGDAQRYQLIVKENGELDTEGVNWRWEVHNRNKQSVAINLNTRDGKLIIRKLIETADIFISNYEIGVLSKFNLDFHSLSEINSRLIYGVLTGYGRKGPDKGERGFDMTAAWARTGIQHLLAEGDSPPPQSRPGILDRTAAIAIVAGVIAALFNRTRTGKGQEIECSLYGTGIWFEAGDIQMSLTGNQVTQNDRTKMINPLMNSYRTKDGRWLQLAMLQVHAHWMDLCAAIGQPDLYRDARFPSQDISKFVVYHEDLIRILDEVFITKSLEEWESILKEHHCIFSRVWTPEEVVKDEQAAVNDYIMEIEHPVAGKSRMVNSPVQFTDDPISLNSFAPELGEHTELLLISLGFTWDDINKFKENCTIP